VQREGKTDIQTLLEGMTRGQKEKWLLAHREKRRREKLQASEYVPNDGQRPVHENTKPVRCVFSGNGMGKTALAVNEAIWALKGYNPVTKQYTPVPCRTVVVLDHPEKVEQKWLPELKKWTDTENWKFEKRGKPYISAIRTPNNSELLFAFHMQEAQLFESIEVHVAIFDEPPPRHVFIALYRGGREKGYEAKYLLVGTPISGPWLRTELKEPWERGEADDVECFTAGTIVNEHNLADGYIEKFKKRLTEKEQRIRLHGEFYDLEGLALAECFDRSIHIISKPYWRNEWPCVVSIDPHMAKPHHAVLLGIDSDNNFHYIKEIKEKCLARDFARKLKRWYQGYRVVDIVSDSLGSSEYTSGEGFKSFISVLQEEGVRVRATSWDDKSDEDFIERIQTALAIPDKPENGGERIPKLRIWMGNPGIVQDIENVQWIKVKNMELFKPKLDISNKDWLACLKYALASNMAFSKHKESIFVRNKGVDTYGIKGRTEKGQNARMEKQFKLAFKRKKKATVYKESWEKF
jgi:hypothetical protein